MRRSSIIAYVNEVCAYNENTSDKMFVTIILLQTLYISMFVIIHFKQRNLNILIKEIPKTKDNAVGARRPTNV